MNVDGLHSRVEVFLRSPFRQAIVPTTVVCGSAPSLDEPFVRLVEIGVDPILRSLTGADIKRTDRFVRRTHYSDGSNLRGLMECYQIEGYR